MIIIIFFLYVLYKVFSHICKTDPEKLQRLIPVEGDICKPSLGISGQDRMIITDNVSVIFHLAATIRFDEHIKKSLQFNVLGVREIVKLARATKNLKVIVFILIYIDIYISVSFTLVIVSHA